MPAPPHVITFYSNGKDPYNVFSNLYKAPERNLEVTWPVDMECVPEFLRGGTFHYPTREHAFQSLRAGDMATAEAFMVRGIFEGWESMKTWPVKKRGQSKDIMFKIKKRYAKKNMEGIVAKLAVGVKPEWWKNLNGLDILPRVNHPEEQMRKIWHLIHAAFFLEGVEETNLLKRSQGKDLAEFYSRAKTNSYYSCRFHVNGSQIGLNKMGLFLQAFRDSII